MAKLRKFTKNSLNVAACMEEKRYAYDTYLEITNRRNALRDTRSREELHIKELLKKYGMNLIYTDQDRVECQVRMKR